MMELTIGAVVIPYEVRESARTRVMKIVVTPGAVEVVVPVGTAIHGPNSVTAYVERKRRWVFNACGRSGRSTRHCCGSSTLRGQSSSIVGGG